MWGASSHHSRSSSKPWSLNQRNKMQRMHENSRQLNKKCYLIRMKAIGHIMSFFVKLENALLTSGERFEKVFDHLANKI